MALVPNQNAPDGAFVKGSMEEAQSQTESTVKATLSAGTIGPSGSYTNAQNVHNERVINPIAAVQGSADVAVSQSEAAANAAAAAEATAASASDRASYFETEWVVASAGVVLGVNEVLLGPVQNVPGGLSRTITDMHIGFITQPGGLTFEFKKWSADGTTATVLGTFTIGANVTRANWASLNYSMATRERVFINVTSITGTVAPTVCQVLIFGVME